MHSLHPRLVVKSFNQRKRIDFQKIFSPIVKMTSIQTVLGLAATLDLKIEHMDVKTTFLHGDLEKEMYIEQAEGFNKKEKEDCLQEKLIWLEADTET